MTCWRRLHECTALSRLERECLLELVERGAVCAEGVWVCARRRSNGQTVGRQRDFVPDVGLRDAARERFRVQRFRLAAPASVLQL
jgi:hypothetical protein